MSKDKEIRTDGRTDKQIRTIAVSGNITDLTDKQYDRYVEVIKPNTYGKSQGGMIKGFSPIARPQRFKGVF